MKFILYSTSNTFELEDIHDEPAFHPQVEDQVANYFTPVIIHAAIFLCIVSFFINIGQRLFLFDFFILTDEAKFFNSLAGFLLHFSLAVFLVILPYNSNIFPDELIWPFNFR